MNKLRANIASSMHGPEPSTPINQGHPGEDGGADTCELNLYLYENLVSNFEGQIAHWTSQAAGLPECELATLYRLKAEGLKYALRLLDAFEEEFRELTDRALHYATRRESQT
jgi:hypothetical protein